MRNLCILLIIGLASTVVAVASLTRDGTKYVLENEYLRLRIDPAHGGMADSCVVKTTGRELLDTDQTMFIDHFWQQRWPGEFMNAPYEAAVVENTPQSVTLEVSCVSKGEGKNLTQAGICIRRRMTLRAGSPHLVIQVSLENTATTGRMAGYWFQSQLYANGTKAEKQVYYAPTIRGVSQSSYDVQADRITVDENGSTDGFTRNPQNSWLAALGAESHNGLACVLSFDELMFLYTCFQAFTLEWQYQSAAIPPGKVWKTEFVLYPLVNLPRVDYASRRLVAAVEPLDADDRVTAKLTLATAAGVLRDLRITGEAMLPRIAGHPAAPFAPQVLPALTLTPAVVTVSAPHDPAQPMVLRFTVTGTDNDATFSESFETWYGGRYGKNWQVDTTPIYVFPAPERHVSFLKPDVIVKAQNAQPRALVCKGLFADDYLPARVFTALGATVTPSYFSPTSTFPANLTYFPASYEDLMSFDIIALINIDAAALGGAGQEMLKDFVAHGGTLVYGGDVAAFAKSGVSGTPLADLLPVTFRDGTADPGIRYLKPQPVLRGAAPLANGAVMLYAGNDFTVKPGAGTVLTCAGRPVVAVQRVGEGRVIALTGTSLGIVPRGKRLYLRTPEWSACLTALLRGDDTARK